MGIAEPITEISVFPFQLGTLAFHTLLAINPHSKTPRHVVAYISRFPSNDRLFGNLARDEFEGLQTLHAGLSRANSKVRRHVATCNLAGFAHLPLRGIEYAVYFTNFIEDADELHVRFPAIIQGQKVKLHYLSTITQRDQLKSMKGLQLNTTTGLPSL